MLPVSTRANEKAVAMHCATPASSARSRTCGNDRANSGKRLRVATMRTAMLSPRFQRDLGKHAELPAPDDAGDVERPPVDDQRVRLTDGAVVRQLRRVREIGRASWRDGRSV